jgi:hypothetical protein
VFRIWDVYPGSKYFHSGSRVKKIPDPGSQIPDLDPQRKMIRDVYPGSGSSFLPIPDPGVKKAPEPGSRVYLFHFLKKVKFVAPY